MTSKQRSVARAPTGGWIIATYVKKIQSQGRAEIAAVIKGE